MVRDEVVAVVAGVPRAMAAAGAAARVEVAAVGEAESSTSSASGSSHGDSRTSSDSSNSSDSGNLPALVGRPARDLEVFGEPPALQSGHTRSQSRGLAISASYANTLLVYAMRTVEAKRTAEAKKTVKDKAAEIERSHNSLLEKHLKKEHEWLEELERRGALLEQREEEQDLDCPIAAVEQQPELSIPLPIGRKPSEVESLPHTVAGVERSVYRKSWEQAMQGAHKSGNLLDGR